jgi:hypothetical protein
MIGMKVAVSAILAVGSLRSTVLANSFEPVSDEYEKASERKEQDPLLAAVQKSAYLAACPDYKLYATRQQ